MATDIREIGLTDEQKQRIAEIAERSGQSWSEVIEERLSTSGDSSRSGSSDASQDRHIKDMQAWLEYFDEWSRRRRSYNPNFDDSRESIYCDRG